MYGHRKYDLARVIELRCQGVTPLAIAERLGVSLATVSNALHKTNDQAVITVYAEQSGQNKLTTPQLR